MRNGLHVRWGFHLAPGRGAALALALGLVGGLLAAPAAARDDDDPDERRTEVEKRYDAALHVYRNVAGADRDDQLREAEDLFQAVIDDFPNTEERIDSIYWRAQCQRRTARPTPAKEGFVLFLQYRTEGDHVTDALHYLGHCYQDLQEWEASLDPFRRVYEEHPDDDNVPACLYDAGKSLRELTRYEEARVLWQRVIDEFPDDLYGRRARDGMPTLRPPRERLQPLIEEYQGFVEELRRGSGRKKKDIHEDVKKVLAKVGEIHAKEAERFLVQVFKKQHGAVQSAAVPPLLAVGGRRSAELLIAEMPNLANQVQVAILKGLRKKHLKGVSLEKSFAAYLTPAAKSQIREETVKLLGRLRNAEAARLLVQAIQVADDRASLGKPGRRTNDAVLRALRDFRERKAVKHLCDKVVAARRGHPMRRILVVEALGFSRSEVAMTALINALPDPTPGLATAAVVGLGRLKAQQAVEAILAQLERRGRDREFLIAAMGTLARLDAAAAAEEVLALSRLDDPQVRTVAVKVIGTLGQIEACFKRLLEGLTDPEWSVRQAALDAARRYRRKEIVDILVVQLGKEDGALRLPVVKLLIDFTGMDLGPDPKAWQEYWHVARETWKDPEVATGEGSKGKTFVRRANPDVADSEYFGVPIVSKKLAFIIDVSGSMSQQVTVHDEKGTEETVPKIDLARDELVRAIGGLQPGTKFNIVRFGSNFTALWQKLSKMTKKTEKQAKRFAQGLRPGGATNIYDSLEFVLEKGGVDTIFLLSDGAPTAGAYTDPGQILEEVKRINGSRQLTIHTIALGYESDFLRRLAKQNRGEYIVAGVRGPDDEEDGGG